jgi:hypothetical protein
VKEHNIYWWAGTLFGSLCDLRLGQSESTPANDRTPVEV